MSDSVFLTQSKAQFRENPFYDRLGLQLERIDENGAEVALPYAEQNSNRSGNLHGGTHATLMLAAAEFAVAAGDRAETVPDGRGVSIDLSYLAAAQNCDMRVKASVLARGRDAAHVTCEICSAQGTLLAQGRVTYALEFPGSAYVLPTAASAFAGRVDSSRLVDIDGSPFLNASGFRVVDGAIDDNSVAYIPCAGNEGHDGAVCDSAVAAFIDTCGSMAAATSPGVDRSMLGATLSLSAMFGRRAAPGAALLGVGRPISGHGTSLSSEVEVWCEQTGEVRGRGQVVYRIPRVRRNA